MYYKGGNRKGGPGQENRRKKEKATKCKKKT
jgi:hypothetical protein